MNFLQDVVKEIGNEYASIVSDGVAAGDTESFIDTGSYISMLWLVVPYLVESLETRSLLSRVSLLLARLSFALGLSSIFLSLTPMLG